MQPRLALTSPARPRRWHWPRHPRAATRGRGRIPRAARLGWAGMGIPRDAPHLRAPGHGQTAGTEPWTGPCGPTRGDGGTSERGAPSAARVGAGIPHPAANATARGSGDIPWGSTGLPFPGRREVAWAGRRARSAFPGLGGRCCHDIKRQSGDTPKAPRLPPGRGQSPAEPAAAHTAGTSPEGRTGGRAGAPMPGCGSFGSTGLPGQRAPRPRAGMLRRSEPRSARGAG